MNEEPGRVRPRRNVVTSGTLSFRKRYEAVGYWAFLAVVLILIIWFLASSATSPGDARNAEATVIAELFIPETATAEAEAAESGQLDMGK
jgi:hypothetical protein